MFNIDNLKFDEKGLIPAVVVDAKSKKVLTVAYMNKESLAISMEKELTFGFGSIIETFFGKNSLQNTF